MTFIMGIDPHKVTHTAVAIDSDERLLARLELTADRVQTGRLLAWAAPLGDDRTWAIESAGGLGKLLAQQLIGVGEHVIDVPPTLSACVRLLGSTKASKNDRNDALVSAPLDEPEDAAPPAPPVAPGRPRRSAAQARGPVRTLALPLASRRQSARASSSDVRSDSQRSAACPTRACSAARTADPSAPGQPRRCAPSG